MDEELPRLTASSAVASLASRVVCHPIDTLKARRMSGRNFGSSALEVVARTFRSEGVGGFYRGFGAVALVGTPAGAVYLTTYEVCKSKVADGPAANFLCGFVAEAVACVLYVPVDVVKERAQVVREGKTFQWTGLYRGYGATLLSWGAYSGLYFLFYEEAKTRLLLRQGRRTIPRGENTVKEEDKGPEKPISFEAALVASLCAGGLASFLTSPLDLAKLRLQVAEKHLGFFALLAAVYKADGLTGLFRGAGARVAFFAPSTAISMACFESLKNSDLFFKPRR